LLDQLKRSSLSLPLNVAEGTGKVSIKEKRRYFSIARDSALECYAAIDVCNILNCADKKTLCEAKNLLTEIVAMLSALCRENLG